MILVGCVSFFHFGTENGEEQLKKAPCIYMLIYILFTYIYIYIFRLTTRFNSSLYLPYWQFHMAVTTIIRSTKVNEQKTDRNHNTTTDPLLGNFHFIYIVYIYILLQGQCNSGRLWSKYIIYPYQFLFAK